MLSATTYVIRPARPSDQPALRRLAFLASANALKGQILVGEIDRVVAAAMSLDEDRIITDGFAHSGLRVRLRMLATQRGEAR